MWLIFGKPHTKSVQAGTCDDAVAPRTRDHRLISNLPQFVVRLLRTNWMALPLALGRETRNFCHRIGSTLEAKLYLRGVSTGFPHQTCDGARCSFCTTTQVRTLHMRRLYAQRPWITTLDAELFLEGWRLGFESGDCIRSTAPPASRTLEQNSLKIERVQRASPNGSRRGLPVRFLEIPGA